ncbi:MAG: hypothetical protein ACPGC9_01200 [Cytophagales bacterium]
MKSISASTSLSTTTPPKKLLLKSSESEKVTDFNILAVVEDDDPIGYTMENKIRNSISIKSSKPTLSLRNDSSIREGNFCWKNNKNCLTLIQSKGNSGNRKSLLFQDKQVISLQQKNSLTCRNQEQKDILKIELKQHSFPQKSHCEHCVKMRQETKDIHQELRILRKHVRQLKYITNFLLNSQSQNTPFVFIDVEEPDEGMITEEDLENLEADDL